MPQMYCGELCRILVTEPRAWFGLDFLAGKQVVGSFVCERCVHTVQKVGKVCSGGSVYPKTRTRLKVMRRVVVGVKRGINNTEVVGSNTRHPN